MKYYVAITIGRNVGNKPMPAQHWGAFTWEIGKTIQKHAQIDGVIFSGDGLGVWDKVGERAHAYIVLADNVDQPALRKDLAGLAKKYKQDAVGCAILDLPNGDESLVYADK